MKNQYVGNIGDYGKYGLLRFLAGHGIKIGVNWYLTKDDGSADGKFTDYLKRPEERIYDPVLFDVLKEVAGRSDKDVNMIEQAGIIPGACFFGEYLKSSSLEVHAREMVRRLWFNNSTLLLKDADLIFADPDNGISYRKTAKTIIMKAGGMLSSIAIRAEESRKTGRRQRYRSETTSEMRKFWQSPFTEGPSVRTSLCCIRIAVWNMNAS